MEGAEGGGGSGEGLKVGRRSLIGFWRDCGGELGGVWRETGRGRGGEKERERGRSSWRGLNRE